jgi:hypothetical protein
LGVLAAANAGCGSDSNASSGPRADAGIPNDANADATSSESACSAVALEEPRVTTTYYVAIAEPGADNVACDGLASSDEGGGHCPFKDLDAVSSRGLLVNAVGVKVALRAGTYVVNNWDGLGVSGAGTSDAERVILSNYAGEQVVLDTGAPDGAGCATQPGVTQPPGCVRQVVRVSGQYTLVQGLTIQNGLAYQLELNGGAHHIVRCNKFRETVDFSQRSDQVKIDGWVSDVTLTHNEHTLWRSQAIDIAGAENVLVENSDFHDPAARGCGAAGAKFGSRDIVIQNNTIHDVNTDLCLQYQPVGGGGTGSPHPEDAEAYRVHIRSNRIWNFRGRLAQFVSCQDCSFESNDSTNVSAGILVSAAGTGLPECSASATGCKPTTNLRIAGNRLKGLDGNSDAANANVFVYVEAGESAGLVGENNLYCTLPVSDARFGWQGQFVTFSQWTQASGTDASSAVAPDSDARCSGW